MNVRQRKKHCNYGLNKKSHFYQIHRECPLCGKTRRAGYIVACPKCREFLSELEMHIEGLRAYMEKQGYSLRCPIHSTWMNLSIQICVKGYYYSVDHTLSLLDLKASNIPMEEILSREICRMCEELIGKSIIW